MTDIYGTLGPGCSEEGLLREMFGEGMTGIRLNLSHMMLSENEDKIMMIRRAAEAQGVDVKILIDLQGPELRIGNLPRPLGLEADDEILLCDAEHKETKEDNRLQDAAHKETKEGNRLQDAEHKETKEGARLPDTEYKETNGQQEGVGGERKIIPLSRSILEMLHEGEDFLMDDGKILARVEACKIDCVRALVLRGGRLSSRKSITVQGNTDHFPALTEADRMNLKTAVDLGVTGVMQPFVRSAEDLKEVREALDAAGGNRIRIYAKIENRTGIQKLDELIPAADEIVIARGDLGNAMPLWELPGTQKMIAQKCREAGRPFMVVTQMLSSMEHAPVPTRAEVSDIYNAVLDGAASVMVTGETAVGEYPTLAIRYLARTAQEAEKTAGQSGR